MRLLLQFFICVVCGSASALTPCCVSRKFTALMMRLQATLPSGATDPLIEDIYSTIDYDADARMEKITGHLLDTSTGLRHEYTEYKDFKNSKRYTIRPFGCRVEQLNELMIAPCVAENFTMLQQYTLGSGAHTLPVTAWEGQYLGSFWMNIHFVDSTCEPLSLQIYGPTPDNAAKLLYAYQFANMKQGHLSSNDVFNIPDSCKPGSQTVG